MTNNTDFSDGSLSSRERTDGSDMLFKSRPKAKAKDSDDGDKKQGRPGCPSSRMTMDQAGQLSELIGEIYDAALDPWCRQEVGGN